MSNQGRPLSPHLSVYRWPITMALSILHRMTGVVLAGGFVILTLWLISAASGEQAFLKMNGLLSTLPGQLILMAISAAFFLHLGNGVRHLFWDAGRGFEKHQANASAWFVIAFAVAATAGLWALVLTGTAS